MEKKRCVLILEPVSKRVNVARGSTVYDALVALNYPIGALCGGAGTCGKCRIHVVNSRNNLSPPSEAENSKLGSEQLDAGMRLACQARILDDTRVMLSDEILPSKNRILVESDIAALGISLDTKPDPVINAFELTIPEPTIHDPVADFSRVLSQLSKKNGGKALETIQGIDALAMTRMKDLPSTIRSSSGKITVITRRFLYPELGKFEDVFSIISMERGWHAREVFGLAIDVGTTTIAGYLINIPSGELAAISAILNPQVAIGEDVISRMTHVMNHEGGTGRAQELVIRAINTILDETCKMAKIKQGQVKEICVVGNTAMHHLLLGLPTRQLGLSPFVPVFKERVNMPASYLGLRCHPNANVYSPPVIAGYVGTDTVGCIVSSRMDTYEKYTLLIDIGTNGELVVGNRDGLLTGSCAAGSALEGAQIEFGMRAAEGAIESVHVDKGTLDPTISIIGNRSPIGICGSGLIDVTAELLRAKVITRRGKINNKDEGIISSRRIHQENGEYKYILFHPEWDEIPTSSGNMNNHGELISKPPIITISQEDIRQIQLAKGAFLSGALLLLDADGKKPSDIHQIVLAGAFGSYINKENAMFIGLFPEVPITRVFQVGNAAGLGARLCLKNKKYRQLANEIATTTR
ncbi:DUF4445 domain-containing protein, partial [Candidatus Bathyarchaeota archaeon]|nr:DUF4445 domain-containing protein [Candidatus Bathyarchaeota archaeon]